MIIWNDGFESGDISAWTNPVTAGTGTVGISGAIKRTGNWAGNFTSLGALDVAYVAKTFTAMPIVYALSYFNLDSYLATNSKNIALMRLSSFTGPLLAVQLGRSLIGENRWNIMYRDTGNQNVIVDVAPSLNSFHALQIATICSSAVGALDGSHYVYVDGVLIWSITGVNTDATAAVELRVGICSNDGETGVHNWVFDDVAIGDAYIGTDVSTVQVTVTASTGGTVSPSGTQILTIGGTYGFVASPSANYQFSQWELGGVVISTNPTLSLVATTEMQGQTLRAVFVPTGGTTITLTVTASAGGTVNPSGNLVLSIGTAYTFNASPSIGYTFSHWELNGVNIGGSQGLTLTITSNMNGQTLMPIFTAVPTGTLYITAVAGTIAKNVPVTVTDGGTQSGTTPVSFTMPAGTYNISATYSGTTLNQQITIVSGQTSNVTLQFPADVVMHTLTVQNPEPSGAGTPTASTAQYADGTVITLTAVAIIGYTFSRWRINGIDGSSNPILQFPLNADTTVQAIFTAVPTLTAEAGGPYSASIRNPTVQFNGSANGGVPPYSWVWQFGDLAISNAQSPAHVYASAGIYTAILTVTDASGNTASDTTEVVISGLQPPIPQINIITPSPVSGQIVSFDGSGSYTQEPNSAIILYEWRFGDGETVAGALPTATHVYATAGTFTVVLTVTDTLGQKNSATQNLVIGQPPHNLVVNIIGAGAVYVYPTSTDGNYPYGTLVDIIATPDQGYYIESFTDNGLPQTGTKITVTMDVDHTVSVTFDLIPALKWSLNVSATPTEGGTTSPSGSVLIDEGVGATVTATPAEGYMFIKWTLDGSDISTQKTVLIPSQASGATLNLVAIFAKFGQNEFPWWVVAIAVPIAVVGTVVMRGDKKGKKSRR